MKQIDRSECDWSRGRGNISLRFRAPDSEEWLARLGDSGLKHALAGRSPTPPYNSLTHPREFLDVTTLDQPDSRRREKVVIC